MKLSIAKQIFPLMFLFLTIIYSQSNEFHTVSGKVVSKETGEPIPYVNVFLDATTLGTATNNNGEYEISSIPTGTYRIIISMIGYERKEKNIQLVENQSLQINFELETHSYKLDEINVTTEKDYDWIDDEKTFEMNFLGTSVNSDECKIVNSEVLEFSKSPDIQLKATAPLPLEIVNEALGYKVFFDLKEFVMSDNREVSYYGNIRFEEMIPENEYQKEEWEERRKEAYRGSLRHFLVSLCKTNLTKMDFILTP